MIINAVRENEIQRWRESSLSGGGGIVITIERKKT